jgi:hypothetical protein
VDLNTIKTVAMWVLIAIAVIGILLAIIIKKIIGKVISLVLAAVLVFFCWQQRAKVVSAADDLKGHACSATSDMPSFFGIGVKLPAGWCAK